MRNTLAVAAVIAVVTALASPALAQSQGRTPRPQNVSHSTGNTQISRLDTNRVDPNHPKLCGGGSHGYNLTLASLGGG